MISVAVFTYHRKDRLVKCLQSLGSNSIKEILLFNDDELQALDVSQLRLPRGIERLIHVYNPQDFGFTSRDFRKPIYLNKAVELADSDFILFSDDDGIFTAGAVDAHVTALKDYLFCAGSIIRDKLLKRKSKSILQGTNYSFQKQFFNDVGRYDEAYTKSKGGGDVDFWYRIYQHVQHNKLPVAFLTNACQNVTVGSKRKKNKREMDPRKYTLKKHDLTLSGPMYKWFPEIRDKSKWMTVIDG